MKPKKYSLLYFHHLCDKYSKWIFPLHEGENIIGSDKNVDIFLYLNETEDKIESIHCKIIVDEYQGNISIISLTDNDSVKLDNDGTKEILSPVKKYELKNKSVFYLGENLKFTLVYDTMDEIHKFFLGQRLENEYQKWKQLISYQESNVKINLNLPRKESLNKSNISIVSNNNNNNNINNNNNNNYNINNSLLHSNTKDVNRVGFNNFDEVPDDNWLNDNENSENKNNLEFSPFKPINSQNPSQNTNLNKLSIEDTPKISQEVNISENNNSNNININDMKDIFHSKEAKIKNEFPDNINLIDNSNNLSKENCDNNSNLLLFKKASSDFLPYKSKFNEEKNVNKDEKTANMIKELLGENNLDIIINNTDFKKIKKFDVFYKKSNKAKIETGNFDIKFTNKTNIFGSK